MWPLKLKMKIFNDNIVKVKFIRKIIDKCLKICSFSIYFLVFLCVAHYFIEPILSLIEWFLALCLCDMTKQWWSHCTSYTLIWYIRDMVKTLLINYILGSLINLELYMLSFAFNFWKCSLLISVYNWILNVIYCLIKLFNSIWK